MADLQVLHNKAARLILDLPPRASASDALERLHWKSWQHRKVEHRGIFTYKYVNPLGTKDAYVRLKHRSCFCDLRELRLV